MIQARIAAVALAVASVGFGIAWSLQVSAASILSRTAEIQGAEVPESDAAPPDVDVNFAILDSLKESIEIRRQIDGLLGEIEGNVDDLRSQQGRAEDISGLARNELTRIGATLGGVADAAEQTVADLQTLEDRLARSRQLARLIAEELEELDEGFGP